MTQVMLAYWSNHSIGDIYPLLEDLNLDVQTVHNNEFPYIWYLVDFDETWEVSERQNNRTVMTNAENEMRLVEYRYNTSIYTYVEFLTDDPDDTDIDGNRMWVG